MDNNQEIVGRGTKKELLDKKCSKEKTIKEVSDYLREIEIMQGSPSDKKKNLEAAIDRNYRQYLDSEAGKGADEKIRIADKEQRDTETQKKEDKRVQELKKRKISEMSGRGKALLAALGISITGIVSVITITRPVGNPELPNKSHKGKEGFIADSTDTIIPENTTENVQDSSDYVDVTTESDVTFGDSEDDYYIHAGRHYDDVTDEELRAWYGIEDEYDKYPDIAQFKDYPGYKEYLLLLKKEHPNWNFKIKKTGLDFNECVAKEMMHKGVAIAENEWEPEWYNYERVLVDGSSWVLPSKEAVACTMDPRNFLNENQIFQFRDLHFQEAEPVEYIREMFSNVKWANADKFTYTNTNGELVTMDRSFADIVYDEAKKSNVLASYLATKIMQEQGSGEQPGKTGRGTTEGYVGYYNYGNINSYGFDSDVWMSGLDFAKKEGWTNPTVSVRALADFVRDVYIDAGQNSIYETKYYISEKGNLKQYMTNFSAAYNEARRLYKDMDYDEIIDFTIPVYENMPKELCRMPAEPSYMNKEYINSENDIEVEITYNEESKKQDINNSSKGYSSDMDSDLSDKKQFAGEYPPSYDDYDMEQ
ncbi:MAG: hypothetical protein IKE01_00510 [Clostridia bacterium]|nr:hypothetical protein [Clostridia bacterium]